MVPGFNTDFKYRGETYHIQTEDNGAGNPIVVTLLYHKGAILASRRTSYREIAGKPGYEQKLVALMKTQHKELMRALLAGALDKDGSAPAVVGGNGQHPADAAAAVAAAKAPPREKAPASERRILMAAVAPPKTAAPQTARAAQPRSAAMTLDEAIRSYLQRYAAAAPGA